MSSSRIALAAVALVLSAALPAQAQKRVLLEMRTTDGALRDLAVHRLKNVHRYEHLPFVAAEGDAAALQAAAAHPDVVAVHEDRLHHPALAQSGPFVEAPQAWDMGYSGAGQHIAILDTGVDRNHPFLAGKVVYEACFSSTYAPYDAVTACPNGQDMQIGSGAAAPCTAFECRHGTHVAGIAAGNGPNASPPQPFSGIARDARLVAIQVFSVFYSPWFCTGGTPCVAAFTSDLMRALDHLYAIRQDYSLASANMSLAGGAFTTHCDGDPLKPAIDLLRSAGVATVVASGNNGYVNAISAPACISSAVSVGATTKAPEGVAYLSNSAWMLNLLAPGVSIQSSVTGGAYAPLSGTSMATPHVAGAFAVLKQKNPAATVDELLTALGSTGALVFDPRNGLSRPRSRLAAALDALLPPGPAPANDSFRDAIALPLLSGNTSGTNIGATKEAGEPDHAGHPGGRSVWWRWTAPSIGPVTFDTLGSGFDTALAAYTGASVSELEPVAANDNAPGTTRSRISFVALQGETYHIAVDGFAGAAGQVILNWAFGRDVSQPGDIAVTPDSGFAASGPPGGPFTPSSIVYTLTNVSTGTRAFSVTGVPSWLTASSTSGILAPGESKHVALSVHASAESLGAGAHSGTVSFNAAPRSVSLTVHAEVTPE